jgi:hypothetical protein
MMMKMNKRRKKSGMSMDKGMKYAKSSKKGMAGDDMLSMDSLPVKKAMGGMMRSPPTAAQVKPAPSRMPTSPAQVKPAPSRMPTSPTQVKPTSMPPSRMPTSPTQVKPRSPLMKAEGGMVSPRKKMAMGYADGGMVQSRGNGAARGKKTRIC